MLSTVEDSAEPPHGLPYGYVCSRVGLRPGDREAGRAWRQGALAFGMDSFSGGLDFGKR